MAHCSDRLVLNSERKGSAGGMSCALSGFSSTETAVHRLQVCACLPGQVQGRVHELPFRPESRSSPLHTRLSEISSWDLIVHAIMPLTTGWLAMVGTVFPSVTSLFPRCTLLRDTKWVNSPGTCSNSLYLVFLCHLNSLLPRQQVTHPP